MSDTQETVDPSCRFPVIGRKEHFRHAALDNTERERGAAAQIGVKTKRKQGSASKIIIFL